MFAYESFGESVEPTTQTLTADDVATRWGNDIFLSKDKFPLAAEILSASEGAQAAHYAPEAIAAVAERIVRAADELGNVGKKIAHREVARLITEAAEVDLDPVADIRTRLNLVGNSATAIIRACTEDGDVRAAVEQAVEGVRNTARP